MLVCGAGIAGIQASLDLAESGFKVYLLDSSPAIGGRMAQLGRTRPYPTGDCAMRPPMAGAGIEEVDFEAALGKVERRLDAGDARAADQHGAYGFRRVGAVLPV